jgi:hypothetical protein
VTLGQATHDKLQYARALLGHAVPSGDLAEVLDRALEALVAELEKRKFGATTRPRPQRSSADPRHIAPAVKRTVWVRDRGQCTFVSEAGHRCEARARLEFDHVDPVARGGEATVEGIRLRCAAHNQYEAECAFGVGFMEGKREAARQRAAEARAAAAEARARAAQARAAAAAEARTRAAEARVRAAEARQAAKAAEEDADRSVVPWLRRLGFGLEEARRGAALCAAMADATLEERLRCALSRLRPPLRIGGPPVMPT